MGFSPKHATDDCNRLNGFNLSLKGVLGLTFFDSLLFPSFYATLPIGYANLFGTRNG